MSVCVLTWTHVHPTVTEYYALATFQLCFVLEGTNFLHKSSIHPPSSGYELMS